jgi:hypothetical protein
MAKNWSDYFAESFNKAFSPDTAMTLAYKRWEEENKTTPKYLAAQALGNPMYMALGGKDMIGNLSKMLTATDWQDYISKVGNLSGDTFGDYLESNPDLTSSLYNQDMTSALLGEETLGGGKIPMLRTGASKYGIRQTIDPVFATQLNVAEAEAKDINQKAVEGKYKALQSVIKDASVLNMFGQSIGDMMGAYREAKSGGFGGNMYSSLMGKAASEGLFPWDSGLFWGQTEKGGEAANRYVSARNETIMRMQPIMSEQFGERGSMRIMDSMIKMGQQEIGDLNQPEWAIIGKAEGTLRNMFRFLKGSANYAKKMNLTGEDISKMTNTDIDAFVRDAINSNKLSPEEEKDLHSFISDTLGTNMPKNMFNSIEEARKANLPPNTEFYVVGEKTPLITKGKKNGK